MVELQGDPRALSGALRIDVVGESVDERESPSAPMAAVAGR